MPDTPGTPSVNPATGGTVDPAPANGPEGAAPQPNSEVAAPEASGEWWKFADKDAAAEWGNKLVQDRLSRVQKNKLDPLEQKNATLEAEIARLKPFEEATLSEGERRDAREAALQSELDSLRSFKAQTERTNLISQIANEAGLDSRFLKFITTDGDESAIRDQVTDLLNALSEGGSNTKLTPTPMAPQGPDAGAGGSTAAGGGGSSGAESDEALVASILEDIAAANKNGGLTSRRR